MFGSQANSAPRKVAILSPELICLFSHGSDLATTNVCQFVSSSVHGQIVKLYRIDYEIDYTILKRLFHSLFHIQSLE